LALRPAVRAAVWTEQWWDSYSRLPADRQSSCDRAAMALISSGDRIVFRVEAGTIFFMDVVKHDDIGRYGRRPRQGR
jgi:hypothetical protein